MAKLQGIPLPGTPFKMANFQSGRFVFNSDRTVFLRDKDNNRMELFFELVPSTNLPQRYFIKSVNTQLALADTSDASGQRVGVSVQDMDESNDQQIWTIEPSSKFPTGYYRVKNIGSKGYLLNGPADAGNYLRTFAGDDEEEDQNWTFIFTDRAGIPPAHTELRIRNDKTKRIIFTTGSTVFLRDAVNNLQEQVFVLVPSKLQSESYGDSYLIQSADTRLYLTDDSDFSGTVKAAASGLVAKNLEPSNKKQVWSLLPATTKAYLGTYRIQNCETEAYLLNGPRNVNNLLTMKEAAERHEQCWTFLSETLWIPGGTQPATLIKG